MKRKKKKTKDEEYTRHLEKKVRNLETENRLLEAERLRLEQELQRLRNEFDRDAERIKFFGDRKRAFKEERKKKKTFQKSPGDREGAFKLCIFGDDGVGKTTLIHRYATKVFDEDIKMTVGADFYEKDLEIDGKKIIIRIWVFGGEQRFKVLLPSFAKGADGGIFMYDITRYTSVKNIDDWLSIFEKNVKEKEIHIPIIMVGGKLDLQEKRSVETEDAVELSEKYNLQGYFECSPKIGVNIEEIFEYITRKMMEFTGLL